MARGFSWSLYVDDTGQQWAIKVDADYALDSDRGWTTADPLATPQLPRGWRPRAAIGLDEVGNTRTAISATTDAPIWTGAVPSFVFEGNDLQFHVATIIGLRGELRLP